MITLKLLVSKAEEVSALETKVKELELALEKSRMDIIKMSSYAPMYLAALDDLKECKRLLDAAGIETDFIRM